MESILEYYRIEGIARILVQTLSVFKSHIYTWKNRLSRLYRLGILINAFGCETLLG